MLPKGIEKDIHVRVVDQCAFGRDYRKTTHVWNDERLGPQLTVQETVDVEETVGREGL